MLGNNKAVRGSYSTERRSSRFDPRSSAMNSRHAFAVTTLLLLSISATGCRRDYHVDTILHADGKVERILCQPDDSFPESQRSPKLWSRLERISEPRELEKQGWDGDLRRLPPPLAEP